MPPLLVGGTEDRTSDYLGTESWILKISMSRLWTLITQSSHPPPSPILSVPHSMALLILIALPRQSDPSVQRSTTVRPVSRTLRSSNRWGGLTSSFSLTEALPSRCALISSTLRFRSGANDYTGSVSCSTSGCL